MAGLDIAAGIIAVLQLAGVAVEYLSDIKEGPKEQIRILTEVSSLQGLLKLLLRRVEDGDDTLASIQQLKEPLESLERILEQLNSKLEPPTGKVKKVVSRLTWHFDKHATNDVLQRVENLKALFILALENDQIGLSKLIRQDLAAVQSSQEQHRQQTAAHAASFEHFRADIEIDKIKQWLAAPDPSTNFHSALHRRQSGTGQWLLDDPRFTRWKQTPGSFLWLHGKPGCGKSVLSATIIEHVTQFCSPLGSTIIYFYFDFNEPLKQKYEQRITSLLIQLAASSTEVHALLQRLYAEHSNGSQKARPNKLRTTLTEAIRLISEVFIILDALDEAVPRQEVLDWIVEDLSPIAERLHLLALSRKERDIEESFEVLLLSPKNFNGSISLDDTKVDEDIGLYIRAQLKTDRKLIKWAAMQDLIENSLLKKANGMFRWAYCQLDALRKCLNKRELVRTLESLPKTLDETYDRIFDRIEEEGHTQEAVRILTWLCVKGTMDLHVMVDLLAIDIEPPHRYDPELILPDPRDIVTFCPGLSTFVDDEDLSWFKNPCHPPQGSGDFEERRHSAFCRMNEQLLKTEKVQLRLAHFSVKEYLASSRARPAFRILEGPAYGFITRHCLQYLVQIDLRCLELVCWRRFNSERPAAYFCASEWPELAAKAGSHGQWALIEDMIWPALGDFNLLRSTAVLSTIQVVEDWAVKIYLEESAKHFERREWFNALALCFLCEIGLTAAIKRLLQSGADVSTTVPDCEPLPLGLGIGGTRPSYIRGTLLRGESNSLLSLACERNRPDVIKLLYQFGADLHQMSKDEFTPMYYACHGRNIEAMEALIGLGYNVSNPSESKPDHRISPAFQDALRHGSIEIIKLLISNGVDCSLALPYINMYRYDHDEALEIVQLVLQQNAQLEARDGYGKTALYHAAERDHVQIVQTLIEHGANTETKNRSDPWNYYRTPTAVLIAARRGNLSSVRVLVENGADIDAKNTLDVSTGSGCHQNALHIAAAAANVELVRYLLSCGMDVDARDGKGATPLVRAGQVFHRTTGESTRALKTLSTLLAAGANVHACDNRGRSAIFHPVCPNKDGFRHEGRGPMPNAWSESLELLLRHGAQIDTRDSFGKTPLLAMHSCPPQWFEARLKILLKHGADINATTPDGETALSQAFKRHMERHVSLLIKHGADFRGVLEGVTRSSLPCQE